MALESKRMLRANILARLVEKGGPLGVRETSGVTRLTALGMSQGNAQRLMDADSDVRLGTIEEVAVKLGASVGDLLSRRTEQALPFRDLDVFEGQLVTFFRRLSDDDRHALLIELNNRTATAHTPSVADPWAGKERRVEDRRHDHDRRVPKVFRR